MKNLSVLAIMASGLILVSSTTSATVPGSPQQPDKRQVEFQNLFVKYSEAVFAYDAKALDALFHKEYVEVSPLGEVDDRAKVLSFYTIPESQRISRPLSFECDEWAFRFPTRDSAVVIVREKLAVDRNGQKVNMMFRSTSTWQKVGRDWKMVSQHVSGMRPTPPKAKAIQLSIDY
jgi:hypothetical protein